MSEPDEIDVYDQAVERELIREANERHQLEDKRWLNMCNLEVRRI